MLLNELFITWFYEILIPNSEFSGRIRVNCKNLISISPYLDDRAWIILKTSSHHSRSLLELNYRGHTKRRPSTRNSYKGQIAAYLIPISSNRKLLSKLLEWRIFGWSSWRVIKKSCWKKSNNWIMVVVMLQSTMRPKPLWSRMYLNYLIHLINSMIFIQYFVLDIKPPIHQCTNFFNEIICFVFC